MRVREPQAPCKGREREQFSLKSTRRRCDGAGARRYNLRMRALVVLVLALATGTACGSRTGLIPGGDAGVATIDASPPLGALCAQSVGEVEACAPDSETGPVQRCNESYPVCARGNNDWGPSQDGAYACCMKSNGLNCAWLGACQ